MTSHFSDEFRSVQCDGGGYTGCGEELEGGTGDRLSDLRRWGRKDGWQRVKDDTGSYIDLCPKHRISTRRGVSNASDD